jgi:MFS family permease
MMGVDGAIGLPTAGLIADHWGFRWLFLLLAAVATAVAFGIAIVVPAVPGRRDVRLTSRGQSCSRSPWRRSCWLLTNASRWGWASPWTLGLLGLCAVLGHLFVVSSRNAAVGPAPNCDIRPRSEHSRDTPASGASDQPRRPVTDRRP